MRALKNIVQKILEISGYKIVQMEGRRIDVSGDLSPYSLIVLRSEKIVDLEALATIASSIPGMIDSGSGRHLYSLCYFQVEEGDVVEIGSWQGRSTSFLARAVENSGNGNFYAVDHFKGNVGKESHYIIEKDDMSDLKAGFLNNIERVGLSSTVNLLDMKNEDAARVLEISKIRFLFIDGDHTREGVERDIALFFTKLVNGAIVVFDDFSRAFPGVIEAVDALLEKKKHSRVMSYKNTLVLKYVDWYGHAGFKRSCARS